MPGELFRWDMNGLALVLWTDTRRGVPAVVVLGILPEHYGVSAGKTRIMTVAIENLRGPVGRRAPRGEDDARGA